MRENFNDEIDYDLESAIEQPKRQIEPSEDENSNRYGLSFLINIPLYKHLGNNILLDANTRNADGEVINNRKYFPRLTLIPFKTINTTIPSEMPASRTSSGSYESNMRPFNPEVADAHDSLMRTLTKSSAKCSELFLNTYGKDGGILLSGLTGVERYADAKTALMTILPLNDEKIFPRTKRNILGEEFTAPFLDQILEYLQSNKVRTRITSVSRTSEQEARLMAIYNEVLGGARNANTVAKAQIATTEQQMSASPQQKAGYDIRDTQFRDAPDPFDLVCLAHRNEIPKNERQLAQAQKMQETNNEPLTEVAQSMNAVAALMLENQKNSQNQQSPVGMTAAEIAELVKAQVAEGIEAYKQEINSDGENSTPKASKKGS